MVGADEWSVSVRSTDDGPAPQINSWTRTSNPEEMVRNLNVVSLVFDAPFWISAVFIHWIAGAVYEDYGLITGRV